MNVWNKVLLGLIAVLLLPLGYFSLVALKTHQHWRATANKLEAAAEAIEEKIPVIKFGDPTQPDSESLQSVRLELYKYLVNRGRVWRNCALQKADLQKGEFTVAIDKPDPHELADQAIVYVFDEAAVKDGGCFLGEFRATVDKTNKKLVALSPTMRLLPKVAARLAAGKGSWTIAEVMPNDMREVFAGMSEEQQKQLQAALPAAVGDEYLSDGKDGKQRKLRDYYVLLKELDRQQTVLLEGRTTAQRHKDYMEAATADAKKQQLFHQEERAALMAELKKVKDERVAALAHEQSLAKQLAEVKAKVDQLIQDNRATAEEIGRIQAEMIRQVDRRTAAVAK